MDLTNIKALAVDIEVDDDQLTNELLSIPDEKWDKGKDQYSGSVWKSIFLTKNHHRKFRDFKTAKSIPHSDWAWDDELDIPYIKSLMKSLPVNSLGMVRAFILDGPLVMHVDSDENTPDDTSYNLGLTIASKLESPMIMPGIEVEEKYVFFNDSFSHGFPEGKGRQISIRVFGDFNYDKFKVMRVYR
jgi:hypothetical protein